MAKICTIRRSQIVAELTSNRFGSMPVINEIPGDALERNTSRSKTFAFSDLATQEHVKMAKPAFGQTMPKRDNLLLLIRYLGLFWF